MFVNNLAYEASAGSGKTFMLVVRYLSLLFKGADPSKILALTFTNKAALEMQERIVITLEELAERGELDEIIKVTQLDKREILQNRAKVLHQFLNAKSKIMTIDSFFAQILRKFSLYASLMPDFSTANAQHEIKLMSRFLKEVSVAGEKNTLISLALDSNKRLGDIFDLLEQFYVKTVELDHISFEKQNIRVYEEQVMQSFNALAQLVQNNANASNTAKNSVEAEKIEDVIAKSWIGRDTLNYRTFSKCFDDSMDTLLHEIQNGIKSYLKAKEQNFFYALSRLVTIYDKAKKALYRDDNELSFNDVTVLVHYLLKKRVDSEFLYFRLDSSIEHILLDEFQDTSILQYDILEPIIHEILSGEGQFNDGSFFFVGDVKQSIYRFRGGVSALFHEVARRNDTIIEPLVTNYRSQKEVVEFVNSVFETKITNYIPQKVREEANGGYVEVIENDELIDEALSQVQRLIEKGANPNDIAILCYANSDGEELKQKIHENGISVVTETTTKLINQRSVKALLEYLKYLYFGEEIYKHNFFALIEQEIKPIRKVDFNKRDLIGIIKEAIESYGLFSNDFNVIRFLNLLSSYSDVEALLFEYERIDLSAAASELNGVRVLTIHKSKGLEYEHVIVIDRLKKQPPDRSTIVYDYDKINLQNIYLRTKNRDLLDAEYAKAIQKNKELVVEDNLNGLYVAFTRAKRNLFIVQKGKDSSFEILGLEKGTNGVLEVVQKQDCGAQKEYKDLEFKELYYGTQSEILATEQSAHEELRSINFGLAMHYMLEMLATFRIEEMEDAKNAMLNKYGSVLEEDEIESIEHRVLALVQSSQFQELTDGELFREKAIKYKNNLRYIDLLVKTKNGSWNVIDYKSSLSYHDEHQKQVRAYVKAVHEITGETVKGYICYLLENEVKIISIQTYKLLNLS